MRCSLMKMVALAAGEPSGSVTVTDMPSAV
jgi:hypothetical protein